MSQSPFRREVLEHVGERRHGQVILTGQVSYWRITALLVAIMACALGFLCLFSYSRKAEVTGLLVPTGGLARVLSAQAGVVTAMSAKEGQTVAAGQELFLLAAERPGATGQDAGATVAKLLTARRDSLLAEQQRIGEQARGKALSYRDRIDALLLEAANLDEQAKLQASRVELAVQELAQFTELEKSQFVSSAQRRLKEAEVLTQRQRLADLGRSKASAIRELAQLRSEASDFETQSKRDQDSAQRSAASLEQDMAENDTRREFRVRAPVAGVLTSITVTSGQTVAAAQPLATVLPLGNQLEAELYAPSHAAGFLNVGMSVQLRYRAYPYQRYGQAKGVIREVSASPLSADELTPQAAAALTNSTEPLFYRIKVKLDSQRISRGELHASLKPGERIDASVALESRSLMAWMFEPLVSILSKN